MELTASVLSYDLFPRCDECEDDFAWPAPDHMCYYTKYQLRRLRGDIIPAF